MNFIAVFANIVSILEITALTHINMIKNFDDLRVFIKLAEKKSFSVVAELENTSTSHISKCLKRLEDGLKTRLINRSTRFLNLTEEADPL